MISQLHMAKSATFAFQKKMQVLADNISNAQTVAFKSKSMNMENMFPIVLARTITEFEDVDVPTGMRRKKFMEYGRGVRISEITKDMSQGTIEVTNNPLHIAVQGRGFFQVRLPDGRVGYTRAGNFHQDLEGNVVTPNGHPLEPPMRIPRSTTEIIINNEGRVFVQVNNEVQPREVGQMFVAVFPNEEGIMSIGQNLYVETAASGQPNLETPGKNAAGTVRQRALEFSNVNVIQQLLDMLMVQRTFDVTLKAIKSADQMLKDGTDIK